MAETGSASSAAAAAETDSANAEYNAHDDSNRLVADNVGFRGIDSRGRDAEAVGGECDGGSGDGEDDADPDRFRTLGWITGVMCPVSLSMFSTLLFLRVGYIVGNAGWLGGVLVLLLAYAILLITVLSISAIATNGQVKAGGVYFMISRTMGLEVGASIGVLFFFANVVGTALYATGVAEGLFNNLGDKGLIYPGLLPSGTMWHLLYCVITIVVNFVICIFGAAYFGKFALFILAAIMGCTGVVGVSFFLPAGDAFPKVFNTTDPGCTGTNCTFSLHYGNFYGLGETNASLISKLAHDNLFFEMKQDCEDRTAAVGFATLFSVLFSGVTGILAGANLSGDLKKPSKAIPFGTHMALLFTFVVYCVLFVFTGLTCDRTLLYNDCQYMTDVSANGIVVLIGTMLCCWCASCSCLIGASRILQAVLEDLGNTFSFLRRLNATSRSGNPYGAVIITTVLSLLFLLFGSLNKIAELCCIFFLLSYFGVNASCFFLDWAAAPNFRPTFTYYHWSLAAVGMILTGAITWFISPMYAGISWSASIVLFIFFILTVRERQQDWGHIGQAVLFHQVRKYLLYLDSRLDHVKYWRPQVILFVSDPRTSCSVIDFVNVLKKGGLYVLAHAYLRDLDECDVDPTVDGRHDWMKLIDRLKVKAFPELTVASSFREAARHLVWLSGVGAMKPNLVVLGFPESRQPKEDNSDEDGEDDNDVEDDFTRVGGPFESAELNKRFPRPTTVNKVDAEEFLGVVGDVLKMRRSICIHRNFENYRHSDWFEKVRFYPMDRYKKAGKAVDGGPVYLDVWLVDFFGEPNTMNNDICALFVLQMACIVSMVKKYSGCTLRTLVRVSGDEVEAADALKAEVKTTLDDARINSTIETVMLETDGERRGRYDLEHLDRDYMGRMNAKIRERSQRTAVSFVYLGRPPIETGFTSDMKRKYLDLLDVLTEGLPPVLLIHGIDSVVTNGM